MPEAKWKIEYRNNLLSMTNRELLQEHLDNVGAINGGSGDPKDFPRSEISTEVIEERLEGWLNE